MTKVLSQKIGSVWSARTLYKFGLYETNVSENLKKSEHYIDVLIVEVI